MKRNTKFTIFTGMFSILLLVGCLMNDESPTKEKAIGLTVEEAQQNFESSVKTFRLSPPQVTRTLDEESLATPLWGKASVLVFENKEIVEVPVEAPATFIHEKRNLADTVSKKNQWCNTAVSLVAEKGTDGSVFFTIARITVEGEYLKRHKERPIKVRIGSLSDFSGAVRYYTMQGELISGCKYSSGKIIATISPCDSTKSVVKTRSSHEVCTESVTEYTDYFCTDVYIGGEFMSTSCEATGSWTQSEWHCHTVQDPDPVCSKCKQSPCVCGQSGGGIPPVTPVAPKAKAIFRNSNMTEANWQAIERMLDKIMKDCMGQALYNGLKVALKGKTLIIQFIDKGNSAFDLNGGGIRLRTDGCSGDFLHEMLHAFQSYRESYNSMTNAKINMEVETHYVQYIYQSNLPEYKNSKWEKRDKTKSRWREISKLSKFIDKKGNLRPSADIAEFESRILNHVIPALYKGGYSTDKYTLDYDRIGLVNFKNLRELTKDC